MGAGTRVYAVPGISCDHCRNAIEGGLAQVEGVTAVAVDVLGKRVRVEGSAADEAIRLRLDELGYEADSAALE